MPGNVQTVQTALNRRFFQDHPQQAAQELEEIGSEAAARLLAEQPVVVAVPVFEKLPAETAGLLLRQIAPEVASRMLTTADPKFAVSVLHHIEPEDRAEYLDRLDKASRQELETLLRYPRDSAGSLMDPRVPRFREMQTVQQAMDRLRQLPRQGVSTLFVVDEEQRLKSRVELRDLALAPLDDPLHTIARPAYVTVDPLAPREEVVDLLEQHHLHYLPVVDVTGSLAGVIWQNALVKAVEEEATVDVQTMVGVSPEERALSKTTFAVVKRQPWLQINLVTAFMAASVVGIFEDTIARNTALAVLLPVVAGQSGNTGAQALAVTMRGLAVREITLRHWARVMWKEARAGLLNGIGVSLTTCIGVFLWSKSVGLTLVIGLSMILSMVIAGVAGSAVPILLTRAGQDPATASSIILTTVTDICGFFSFLGIATLLSTML